MNVSAVAAHLQVAIRVRKRGNPFDSRTRSGQALKVCLYDEIVRAHQRRVLQRSLFDLAVERMHIRHMEWIALEQQKDAGAPRLDLCGETTVRPIRVAVKHEREHAPRTITVPNERMLIPRASGHANWTYI